MEPIIMNNVDQAVPLPDDDGKDVVAVPPTVSIKKVKQRIYKHYNNYTKKLLEQTCDAYRIRKESCDMFNIIIDRISIKLITESSQILTDAGRTNMTDRDIMTAVILIFPDKLASQANEYSIRAVRRFKSYVKIGDKPISKHIKAGLVYPVSRSRTKIEEYLVRGKHIGELAAVFLAAVLEYVVIQILEPSCGITATYDVITVNNRHIKTGTYNNKDLHNLFKRVGLYFCNNQVSETTSNFKRRAKSHNNITNLDTLVIPEYDVVVDLTDPVNLQNPVDLTNTIDQ